MDVAEAEHELMPVISKLLEYGYTKNEIEIMV